MKFGGVRQHARACHANAAGGLINGVRPSVCLFPVFFLTLIRVNDVYGQWRRHGVDMSTPLLLEVAPEIDTNSTSFFQGGGVGGRSNENEANLLLPLRTQKVKGFQLQGDFAPLTP